MMIMEPYYGVDRIAIKGRSQAQLPSDEVILTTCFGRFRKYTTFFFYEAVIPDDICDDDDMVKILSFELFYFRLRNSYRQL